MGDRGAEEKERRETLRKFVLLSSKSTDVTPLIAPAFLRKLVGILAKLKPLSEQHGLAKFLKNADHANILNGFVQDLSYAITDYQVRDAHSAARVI